MYRAVAQALDVNRDIYEHLTPFVEVIDEYNRLMEDYVNLVQTKSNLGLPISELKMEYRKEVGIRVNQLSGLLGILAEQTQNASLAQNVRCAVSEVYSNAWQVSLSKIHRVLHYAEEHLEELRELDQDLTLYHRVRIDYQTMNNGEYTPFKRINIRKTVHAAIRRAELRINRLLRTQMDPFARLFSQSHPSFYAEYNIARTLKHVRTRYMTKPADDESNSTEDNAGNPTTRTWIIGEDDAA